LIKRHFPRIRKNELKTSISICNFNLSARKTTSIHETKNGILHVKRKTLSSKLLQMMMIKPGKREGMQRGVSSIRVVELDKTHLSFSPIDGLEGVPFVTTSQPKKNRKKQQVFSFLESREVSW